MAKASYKLIEALRITAERIDTGGRYEWGHMAHCNCGNLVQTITKQAGVEITKIIKHSLDEWTEHANDICSVTGNPVEMMFDILASYGFDRQDVIHLEWLTDKKVLNFIAPGTHLLRNDRKDLIIYLKAMADMLQTELALKEGNKLLNDISDVKLSCS